MVVQTLDKNQFSFITSQSRRGRRTRPCGAHEKLRASREKSMYINVCIYMYSYLYNMYTLLGKTK